MGSLRTRMPATLWRSWRAVRASDRRDCLPIHGFPGRHCRKHSPLRGLARTCESSSHMSSTRPQLTSGRAGKSLFEVVIWLTHGRSHPTVGPIRASECQSHGEQGIMGLFAPSKDSSNPESPAARCHRFGEARLRFVASLVKVKTEPLDGFVVGA
jgi:hypothetical protein